MVLSLSMALTSFLCLFTLAYICTSIRWASSSTNHICTHDCDVGILCD